MFKHPRKALPDLSCRVLDHHDRVRNVLEDGGFAVQRRLLGAVTSCPYLACVAKRQNERYERYEYYVICVNTRMHWYVV